ncbi:ABC transporter substrate-binding protein [Serpentinicella sp. ANB-PHB4]|uniref:ABC transporter substrate-binding protein n=1 Tax=Serpentinicella sp. ANB-PHB4 TaxID=3074076 RepID=UPI00285AF29D|nr:ABC transporter substrate-binding protein [Serpentinicella sp. ANB-PHB4]MDR5659561.1 ABC transporter substrate-binding protein [Serpentinicella sp. ANB-PHB4]
MFLNVKRRKTILICLLILVVIITVIGCGQDTEGTDGYAQGVTDDQIKIGTIGVMSGPLSFIGAPYFQGMEAYLKMINDDGGVNGRTIQLFKEDDEFDPGQAIASAERLVYDENVFAIVGQLGTPGVMATAEIVEQEGMPSVYFGSGAAELTELGENFFPVQPNYVYEGMLMSKYAIDYFEAESIAVLYSNDDVGNEGIIGIREGLDELGKRDLLTLERPFNPEDTDFTTDMLRTIEADPDLVIVFGLSNSVANILSNAEEYNVNVPMLTTYSNADASFLVLASDRAPVAVENVHVMGWLDVEEEKLEPLINAMETYFPQGNPFNAYTMAGWVAAETFVAGLREAGDDLTWEGYINAMDNLHFTEGLAPEISFAPGERQGVTMMAISEVVRDDDGNYMFQTVTDFNEF